MKGGIMHKSAIKFLFWTSLLMILVVFSSLSVYAESPVTTKDFDIFSWRHIGPFTFSGRITDVAVPQGQSLVYYVATATGGLWKTEDAGTHFEPIFDKYGNMSMGHIAVAPSDHNILYLGTGEAHHARSTAHGNGVWKSTDAGKTWKLVGLEKSFIISKIKILGGSKWLSILEQFAGPFTVVTGRICVGSFAPGSICSVRISLVGMYFPNPK